MDKGAVLITGGAARIGASISRDLARQGWTVIIHYRTSGTKAAALKTEIEAAGGQAVIVQANLSVPGDVASLINRAAELTDAPITALINNASTFSYDTAATHTDALFDHHIDVNLRAPLALSRDFAAQLPAGQEGAIINLIDQRVFNPDPEFFTYGVAKAGLYWATQTLAQALAPRIRVNGIGPGPTLRNHMQSEAEFDAERRSTLLGNGSPVDQITLAVNYLLNAESVTGQMIAVDGGQHLNWTTS